MDNTDRISITANIGFSYIFACTFVSYLSNGGFNTNTLTYVNLALAIAASVMSFFLMSVIVREFKQAANRKYFHDFKKKADIFLIFGLFLGVVSAAFLSLHFSGYNVSADIASSIFLIAVFFFVLSRHYRHKSRQKIQSFTSMGTLLSCSLLFGAAILCYQTVANSMSLTPRFNHEKTIVLSLLGISLLGVIGILIKDVFSIRCAKSRSTGVDIPTTYPYKISAGLERKAVKDHSPQNTLFINEANKFYNGYIKNHKTFNPNLVSQITHLYMTYILVNHSDINALNLVSDITTQGNVAYNKFTDDNHQSQGLMKNLRKVYDATVGLVNRNARMRYNQEVDHYSHYCWLLLPSIGMILGGLSGYGIQQAFGNELFVVAGCTVGWLIGYGIGEAIFHDKLSNCLKQGMEAFNNKLGCV
jgi:hypothetical protein